MNVDCAISYKWVLYRIELDSRCNSASRTQRPRRQRHHRRCYSQSQHLRVQSRERHVVPKPEECQTALSPSLRSQILLTAITRNLQDSNNPLCGPAVVFYAQVLACWAAFRMSSWHRRVVPVKLTSTEKDGIFVYYNAVLKPAGL